MKKTAFLAAISSAVCLLLTACSGGQTSDSAPDPSADGTGTTTAPTTAPTRDDSAVIDRLGVDYRAHWKQYLMEFEPDSCDYWFIREGDTYHAYFLEFDTSDGGTKQHIAHATSTDFLNWEYQGVVLYGWGDTWDNRNLATGSVAKCGDTYYMLYTGHSTGRGGLGLAKSSDLYTWERVGDGPVLPSAKARPGYPGPSAVSRSGLGVKAASCRLRASTAVQVAASATPVAGSSSSCWALRVARAVSSVYWLERGGDSTLS